MHVLRHPSEVLAFSETHHDAQITALIQQRMEELLTDDDTDMEELVFVAVLESADTVGGCAEFCVNGQSTAGESLLVRKHNDNQEARSTARTAGQPAGRLQEA